MSHPVGWELVMEPTRLSSRPSASFSLAVDLSIAALEIRVVILLCGGRPGGGGSSNYRRVLCRVSWFVEWHSFVEASCRPSGSSVPSLLVLYLAIAVALVLAQLQPKRSWWGDRDFRRDLESF